MNFASFHQVCTLVALLFILPACAGEKPGGPMARSEDMLLAGASAQDTALLTSLRLDLLRTAFRNLDSYTFTRMVRTEQLDDAGGITARENLAFHYRLQDGSRVPTVEPLAAAGEFDFGVFGRVTTDTDVPDPSLLADAFIPEDPPYLSPRSWENFTYSAAPDTFINGIHAEALEVRALPDAAEQPAKHALLYYDPQSYAVIALYEEHVRPALVFDESTTLYVQVRPGPEGQWLPDTTSVSTRIRLPLMETRHFRTTSRFTGYSRIQRSRIGN